MDWAFEAEVFQWRGPAPYFFVATPPQVNDFLHAHHSELTYGWGVIPAQVRIGATEVTTSLIPKDGVYLVPLKVALRRPEGIDDGDAVRVGLHVGSHDVSSPCEGTAMTTFVIDAQVAIDLVVGGVTIPPQHSLTAPTLLRSQVLALVYESVRRGDIDKRTGRKILDDICGLRIRLLGDRSMQDHAWQIAAKLNLPNTYQAEYIALTQLQADALVTADDDLALAAQAFVTTASPADILRS
ncbi:DUF1905 domain-containing protein [Mycolicibacterium sarraceniae]|uniref:DUF1905 domain-containing protein n=1 Tax=Mycolicibacterium sarraceniae TaxID=1534348 RepID=UPI0013CF6D2F|nr:DUF1905 domain-containing protein [Mycolicibacterium sarraceniae]